MLYLSHELNNSGTESGVKILKYQIREIRIEKGLTTYELAQKAGITRMALWRIETNQSDAKASTLQSIAAVLGVGIEELFLRDDG